MNYTIHISRTAEQDLRAAVDYITTHLQNPQAARRLGANALADIDSLEIFPARFPAIDDPFLAPHQIHLLPVQNYLLFYRIDEPSRAVHILRFLYGRSDWQTILHADNTPT